MMTRKYLALFALGVVILFFTLGARQQATSFIITGADDSATYGVTAAGRSFDVAPRMVLQYTDGNRAIPMGSPPPVEIALDRFIMESADGNRFIQIAYPLEVVDDSEPPAVMEVEPVAVDSTTVTISWTTDEFADSVVRYGTQSGTYTDVERDPLYVKNHQITLSGLTPDATYYYRAESTDQSGNTAQSAEMILDLENLQENLVYLPLLLRDR